MNKTQLVASISEKSGLSKKESEKALSAFTESIVEALQNGDKVSLVGFGTFDVRHRAARQGLNPRTKEPIEITASNAPAFKAGKAFKDALN